MHICFGNITSIGSDNGLSPARRQAIIWTNAGILSIAPLGTNFSENLIEIHTFSFKKMHLNRSSAKWRPFCLDVLRAVIITTTNKTQQNMCILYGIYDICIVYLYIYMPCCSYYCMALLTESLWSNLVWRDFVLHIILLMMRSVCREIKYQLWYYGCHCPCGTLPIFMSG